MTSGRNHFKRVKGSMPVSPDRRFNRKFNVRRKRIERWHNIVVSNLTAKAGGL